jgi:uncharacterized membrane-anchored protein
VKLPNYRLGVVIAFVLQIGLLGWIIADRANLLRSGQEIRLAVVPIDPHDLFRGDFVTLRYDISTLHNNTLAGDDDFTWQDPVYVALVQDAAGAWSASAITHTPPADGIYLAGTIDGVDDESGTCAGATACQQYDVAYNLEQFFVPEGTGRELETLRNDQKLAVDVAVGSNGRAALKRLLVDGTPRYEEKLY